MRSICTLSIHDTSVAAADVLLNLNFFRPDHNIVLGDIWQLSATSHSNYPYGAQPIGHGDGLQDHRVGPREKTQADVAKSASHGPDGESPVNPKKGYYFIVREMDHDVLSRLPGVQVC